MSNKHPIHVFGEVLQTVKARRQGTIFIDVNLRSLWWDGETLLPLLQDADWVKLNED